MRIGSKTKYTAHLWAGKQVRHSQRVTILVLKIMPLFIKAEARKLTCKS